jgi:hypothetical protein
LAEEKFHLLTCPHWKFRKMWRTSQELREKSLQLLRNTYGSYPIKFLKLTMVVNYVWTIHMYLHYQCCVGCQAGTLTYTMLLVNVSKNPLKWWSFQGSFTKI